MAVTTEPRNYGTAKPRNHGVPCSPWLHGSMEFRASVVAQSAVEYAVLIAIVVAALVGMSVYAMRALSGKWRQAGDTFGYGRQYEPTKTVVSGQ